MTAIRVNAFTASMVTTTIVMAASSILSGQERPAARREQIAAYAVTSVPPQEAAKASDFAGKWTLSVTMGADVRTADLTVTLAEGRLTGTLFVDHAGLMELQRARVEDGVLLFEVPTMDQAQSMNFSLRVKDATLDGTLTGPMGDMKVTGKRP